MRHYFQVFPFLTYMQNTKVELKYQFLKYKFDKKIQISDSDEDDSGHSNTKNSQLGLLQNICLDSVYMNYLKKKADEQSKKGKKRANKNDSRMVKLMQQNQKVGEFTPEQKKLYDSYDVLMAEFNRRKEQRKKVGSMLKKNSRNLKGLLQAAMGLNKIARGQESDLALKARGNDLQNRRRKNKKFSAYGDVDDQNKI